MTRRLTAAQFGAHFRDFRDSAFRLEGLQHYDTPSDHEAFTAWQQGAPAQPNEPWCEVVRAARARGAHMDRVRIAVEPLNEYTRWELGVYEWSVRAGETIHIRRATPNHPPLGPDFWLFDDQTAVLMDYDGRGRFHGGHLARDIAPLRVIRDIALNTSVRLADYLEGAAARILLKEM